MSYIDNFRFFRIVEKQIREGMQQVETELLPIAEQALKETGLTLEEHPVEGYYGATRELASYFNHLKTLQLNYSDKTGIGVKKLHYFYTNNIFGFGQAVRTALNSRNIWYPDAPPVVISPMIDPLTCAITRAGQTPSTIHEDLTIENITKVLELMEPGTSLVGFGSLVDKIERRKTGEYNPIATTLAREATVLSAYVPGITSSWGDCYQVSPELENHGNRVIDAYNSLFRESGSRVTIQQVTKNNAFQLERDLTEDLERCVRLFNLGVGKDEEFYHWAVSGRKVIDFWRKEMVTTDRFKENPEKYRDKRI